MVTAVIVAHDGAAWLPHLLDALAEQTRPVQRVVAVDTGSRDRSGAVLAARLGQGAVFGMDRATGYATAVRRAVQHKAASVPVAAAAGGSAGRGRTADQAEWLWLLHDDCEPAPDALEQLLRGAAETPTAAVLGPKLRDWTDRRVITEAGLTLDTAGRRITGVEPREVDQGQHDGDRDTLAVCSAGMLVRRDIWEQTGGFDPGMLLFGEDIDFCWRVHEVGYRVRVITDAVVYHAAAATKRRRAISVGRRARLLDRRNGLATLLGNLPPGPMMSALIGNLTLSLLRTVFYLVAKRPGAALDESAAVLGLAGHPLRLARARGRRARGRRAAYASLRADLPAGHSVRRAMEFAASMLSRSPHQDLAGAHHATDDPDDDESLLTDSAGLLQRLLTRPGVLLVVALIAITIAAERSVITSGTLGGGALLPAWEGASSLWSQYLQAYHPVGIGSASAGPPYVGLVALLATVLLGKAWLAVDVLLLGCVPFAGITALLALRRVTLSVPVRVWAAAAYALLPVASGAISAGRLGTAVVFPLIPVIGLLAGRMLTQQAKIARRAAWATGLTVTVGAAFVPLLWPMAVAGAVLAGLAQQQARLRARGQSAALALWRNLAIVVLTPPVLLLPWLSQQLQHPSLLLLEAGIQHPGLAASDLPARSLLLLSPGGPGLPPYWASAALVFAGLLALLAPGRRKLIIAGWIAALLGFAAALLASRVTVSPPGGATVTPWPGLGLAVAAAGLVVAAAAAADAVLHPDVARNVAGRGRSGSPGRGRAGRRSGQPGQVGRSRRLAVALAGLVACSAPVIAAGYWLLNGVGGPLGPASGEVVPSLVSTTANTGLQLRTLVLTPSQRGGVSFLLLRGPSPQFGDPALTPVPAAQTALSEAVASLVAPGGGEAANQSQELARFDIGFVLMRAPIDASLASVLDGVSGLSEVSTTSSFDLWRLSALPSRVSVVEPSGATVAIPSGAIGVSGASAPAAGGTLLLSEPSGGWSAAVNGHALTPVSSPAGRWAQAFRLPPGGGTLTISRDSLVHDLVMALELIAFAVVAALALPGIRSTAELEAAAAAAPGSPTGDLDAQGDVDGSGDLDGPGDLDGTGDLDETGGRTPAGVDAERELVGAGRGSRAGTATDAGAGLPGRGPAVEGRMAAGGPAARMQASGRDGEAGFGPDDATRTLGRGRSLQAGRAVPGETAEQSGPQPAVTGHGARRGGRLPLPGRRAGKSAGGAAAGGGRRAAAGGAAAGAALGADAAAGAFRAGGAGPRAAAGSAGAAAGAGRGGGAGPDSGRGAVGPGGRDGSRPTAAWPAGQPVSRFVSGPPEAANRPDLRDFDDPRDSGGMRDSDVLRDVPYRRRGGTAPDRSAGGVAPDTRGGSGRHSQPHRHAASPSGMPFDEPPADLPGRPAAPRYRDDQYRDDQYRDAPYSEPGYRDSGYGNRGQGQQPGHRGSEYGTPAGYEDGGYERPRFSPGRDYVRQGDYADEAGYLNQGGEPQEYSPSWRADDGASGWPSGSGGAGQAADQQPGAWPQDDQGWPQDHRGWPDQGQALEALPEAEVHHDWPARDGRGTRGWPSPEQDNDGEDW